MGKYKYQHPKHRQKLMCLWLNASIRYDAHAQMIFKLEARMVK